MRRFIVFLLAIFWIVFLGNCATTATYKDNHKNYSINVPMETNVGSPMVNNTDVTWVEVKEWVGYFRSKDGYKITKTPTEDSFKEELIYTGRTGNTIRVSYREYKENFARPAFYQDLTYDLGESDVIVFRNYRIRVIQATNQYIRFNVITE